MPNAVTVRSDDPAKLVRRKLLVLEPCGDAGEATARRPTRGLASQNPRCLQIPRKPSRPE